MIAVMDEHAAYDRLRTLMAGRGHGAKAELARSAGIGLSTVSRGLNHSVGLDTHWPRIAQALGVSLDWLVHGTGEATATRVADPAQQYGRPHCRIPIVGTVTAGYGEAWVDDSAEQYAIDAGVCLVRVRGGSGGSVIRDGQYAVLAPEGREPRDGDLVAVLTQDRESYVKRYRKDTRHGMILLTPCDPSVDGEAMALKPDEVARLRVVIGCLYE